MWLIGDSQQHYDLSDTPIGSPGGEGSVYAVHSSNHVVAKIYHPGHATPVLESKLKIMVANQPEQSVLSQIAWPLDILYNSQNQFVGFTMPKLDVSAELREIYTYPPEKYKDVSVHQKIILAMNICAVIQGVHDKGYVFGDFNPSNIGVNLSNSHVAFFDTDSCHIKDPNLGVYYRCTVCADGYVAPELIKKCKGIKDAYASASLPTFTEQTDNFALAIHIFKLLMNGFSPFTGIDDSASVSQASPGFGNQAIERNNYCFKAGKKPQAVAMPALEELPSDFKDLFSRAFLDGNTNPDKRPSAEEWYNALSQYEAALKQCASNPSHQYYGKLKACPWCEAKKRYDKSLAGFQSGQITYSPPTPVSPPAPQGNKPGYNPYPPSPGYYIPNAPAASPKKPLPTAIAKGALFGVLWGLLGLVIMYILGTVIGSYKNGDAMLNAMPAYLYLALSALIGAGVSVLTTWKIRVPVLILAVVFAFAFSHDKSYYDELERTEREKLTSESQESNTIEITGNNLYQGEYEQFLWSLNDKRYWNLRDFEEHYDYHSVWSNSDSNSDYMRYFSYDGFDNEFDSELLVIFSQDSDGVENEEVTNLVWSYNYVDGGYEIDESGILISKQNYNEEYYLELSEVLFDNLCDALYSLTGVEGSNRTEDIEPWGDQELVLCKEWNDISIDGEIRSDVTIFRSAGDQYIPKIIVYWDYI